MRDGIQLAATLYLPEDFRTPAPAIFVMTPYTAQIHHDRGIYFSTHGYPFLAIDCRGRGDSEGSFEPFATDSEDGYEVVEWLARQPYCNGKVAMWGGSYSGYNQWATARSLPPHLSTIVPVASSFIGVDFPIRGNIPAPYLIQWLAFVSGRTSHENLFRDRAFWSLKFRRWFESGAAFGDLDEIVCTPSELYQEWVSHPRLDEYWDARNPTAEDYARLDIPVLTITGAYDADQPGALAHYREHLKHGGQAASARHCLVIGPWDHAGTRNPKAEFAGLRVGPASLIDLRALHLQWYEWTLGGGSRPAFLQRNVAYYVMGSDRWRYADALEDATTGYETLFLTSVRNPSDPYHSGCLDPHPRNRGGPDEYVHDPRDVRLAGLESTLDSSDRTDQRMVHARVGFQLIYHSAPFEKAVEVTGFFRLTAWFAIDQLDTDFCASIYEIDASGRSTLLTTDTIRARYRESLRYERLVRTTEPLQYEFVRFMFVSRIIDKGSRLRLVIGPLHSIHYQKNFNGGGIVAGESIDDARVVRVRLFHDETHASALHVPIGRSD